MDATDRRYHKRQFESALAELERVTEKLTLAKREIADDDYDASEDTRARLVEAIDHVSHARGSVEDALRQLPTPAYLDAVEGHYR
jgi:hypothetical protein